MGVYVDRMMPCVPNQKWRHKQACHLLADSDEELHELARRIGVRGVYRALTCDEEDGDHGN